MRVDEWIFFTSRGGRVEKYWRKDDHYVDQDENGKKVLVVNFEIRGRNPPDGMHRIITVQYQTYVPGEILSEEWAFRYADGVGGGTLEDYNNNDTTVVTTEETREVDDDNNNDTTVVTTEETREVDDDNNNDTTVVTTEETREVDDDNNNEDQLSSIYSSSSSDSGFYPGSPNRNLVTPTSFSPLQSSKEETATTTSNNQSAKKKKPKKRPRDDDKDVSDFQMEKDIEFKDLNAKNGDDWTVASPHLKKIGLSPDTEDDPEYYVEKVLDIRYRSAGHEYLVKWWGWGNEFNSWEPPSNFSDKTPIRDFLTERKQKSLEKRSARCNDLV